MRPNKLRAILSSGGTAFGTMIGEVRNPSIATIFANAGFDYVFVDMEHGAYSLETAADIIRTARLTGMTALVRAPDAQYHLIARLMDAGAEGVMVPRVETREAAEVVVSSVRYPPLGVRGLSTSKGHNDFRSSPSLEFTRQANQENLVILQIERREAIEHIDDLLSVPGVDAAIIGPIDLSVSLGVPTDFNHPTMVESINKVVEAGARHGVWVGMHTGGIGPLVDWHRKGMRLITWSTDIDMLNKASAGGLAELKKQVGV
jgi:2-keto-3-deoxy-L-rhamnonate aldolase RhmA